jgi:transposase InsO family protein
VIRYLMKISGYSRQHLTRLIAQHRKTGRLQRRQRTVCGFKQKYTATDIRLLAAMDERRGTPCGAAVKKLCERACEVFGQTEYATLSAISVSHLYNLRKSIPYTRQRRHFQKTRSRPSSLGERRKPEPDGKPGFIRIDTVHQGDLDKRKGVYHINAVDEVTQFETLCTVEKISEHYLIAALQQLLETFPFTVLGFHRDNGSEYINKRVVDLLEKLRIEFIKSRSRQSNDNALVESKNGAVVRKHFGNVPIPRRSGPDVKSKLLTQRNRVVLPSDFSSRCKYRSAWSFISYCAATIIASARRQSGPRLCGEVGPERNTDAPPVNLATGHGGDQTWSEC